jgi:hypothetical protein
MDVRGRAEPPLSDPQNQRATVRICEGDDLAHQFVVCVVAYQSENSILWLKPLGVSCL